MCHEEVEGIGGGGRECGQERNEKAMGVLVGDSLLRNPLRGSTNDKDQELLGPRRRKARSKSRSGGTQGK